MSKQQYVRKQIIKNVISVDALILLACVIGFPVGQFTAPVQGYMSAEHMLKLPYAIILSVVLVIVIATIFTALICYFDREKYEEKFEKMESKKYLKKRFSQSDRFEIKEIRCIEYQNFFAPLQKKGKIQFFANLDPDSDYVMITVKLTGEEEQELERIKKEEFLNCYQ